MALWPIQIHLLLIKSFRILLLLMANKYDFDIGFKY
jgi:hypothetical protein